ncbi:MAG: cysteine hydrolase [Proteobacteria bacterium]|nr:cysteine hydrolase [Pseudomonadota bacterium]
MAELPIDPYFIARAKSRRGGRLHAYGSLTPSKTALVVVDMQDYFVKDTMPSPVPGGRAIVANINRLAQAVRAAKGLVIWIQTEVPADADDWANRREATSPEVWSSRRELLSRNGEGFAIFAALDVRPEDRTVIKIRYSAFIPHPSELDTLVKEQGIDTLLITGVATSTCCDSTARDASMWGWRTIMVSDGNADQTEALHRHTLGKFLVSFGDVQSTDQLIGKLAAAGATADAE